MWLRNCQTRLKQWIWFPTSWPMPGIPKLRKLKQEDQKFKVIPGYIRSWGYHGLHEILNSKENAWRMLDERCRLKYSSPTQKGIHGTPWPLPAWQTQGCRPHHFMWEPRHQHWDAKCPNFKHSVGEINPMQSTSGLQLAIPQALITLIIYEPALWAIKPIDDSECLSSLSIKA